MPHQAYSVGLDRRKPVGKPHATTVPCCHAVRQAASTAPGAAPMQAKPGS